MLKFYLTIWRIRNVKWESYQRVKETTASKIKGEKQLPDLTGFVQLISDKFDEYEKDRKARDKLITKLQTQVTELTDKVSHLSVQADKQEEYSRRNCLLIHGVKENQNEDTDTSSISPINEHLGLDIQPLILIRCIVSVTKIKHIRKVE